MHWRRLKPYFAPPFEPAVDRPSAVTVPIAGVRQARTYSCGFASVLMILRSFGRSVDGKELFEALGTGRSGTRQNSIIRELRRRQISANVRYDFTFDALARSVDAGKLVIGYLVDAEHWLVLFGYERDPDRVFVADPRPGEDVEHLWPEYGERLGRFGIVCSPRARRQVRKVETKPAITVRETSGPRPPLPPREQLLLPYVE